MEKMIDTESKYILLPTVERKIIWSEHHITYVPPNKTSQVRYLLYSFQTGDPMICFAETEIQANDTKMNSFEEAADFIIITACNDKYNEDHIISQV